MNIEFESPFGALTLKRFPYLPQSKSQQNLQAWDGADTLVLEALKEEFSDPEELRQKRVLILNDQFGALSVALRHLEPDVQSDSFLSQTAIEKNLLENTGNNSGFVRFIPSTHPLTGAYDLVVMRVPKSLNYLEHQLLLLRDHVQAHTRIIGTSMAKTLSPNVKELFRAVLGPSEQSLAKRKARLIHCTPDPVLWRTSPQSHPYQKNGAPVATENGTAFEAQGLSFTTQANVFSHSRIDPGTRVFLEHLSQLPPSESVLDLACGSGVMGISAALQCGAKELYLCDESYMAIASAESNAKTNCPQIDTHATVGHSIPNTFPQVDLIVNNPPFHQQQTKTSEIALQMFRDAKRHLKHGGQLWVIANRHLDYYRFLKKLFGNCTNQSRNNKYVLLQCTKLAK